MPTPVFGVPSRNYRFELGAVSRTAYPTTGRPIGVFRGTGPNTFRYRVFFPGDPGYPLLAAGLALHYKGPQHHLKRIVVGPPAMQAIWGACPV